MKIVSVEILQLAGNDGDKYGIPWNPTIVRINTDEGSYGIGEIGLPMGNAAHGQVGLARDYAALLIGQDPFRTEAIWEMLYRRTFWGMAGGILVYAVISAIDNALWDLKGKVLGVPVYQLLGGKTNDRLRTYASQIQFDWGAEPGVMVTPDDYCRATEKAINNGFDCVKVNPIGFDLDGRWMTWNTHGVLTAEQVRTASERMASVRKVGGEDLDIIVELHCHTDSKAAVQLAREMEQYRVLYFEEATAPMNWKAMKDLRNRISIPIATGERLYGRFGFRPYIENQAVDLIQPDLGNAGGFTEVSKICAMAAPYDVGVQLHLIGSPISTAAALQMEAVLPNFVIHEHNNTSLIPANIDMCVNNYQPKDGYFTIPDEPGIGQDLTPAAYEAAAKIIVK
ncbi:mandelate racemase/muconate lactonizing enzyme family protein [Halomonas ramblicola]|uniref:mandelate racemase/muconate lactonizing enzyme family protein n=1 Tax=Halomonas ramblicola TaxID=747349 RepID=UPI0025B38C42|nr:mandelate racemase/muconate lactonizing enzyme family protein [Halomonas ramblicola]MDN3523024.1 mandelate racemase/muconate lactonizing enzyme family protein [Halomonas ramblicola]